MNFYTVSSEYFDKRWLVKVKKKLILMPNCLSWVLGKQLSVRIYEEISLLFSNLSLPILFSW